MDILLVDVDVANCRISIYNNGKGIPIEIHGEEGVYVPEMIFGHLSNLDHNVEESTGGRIDYGVKLANIFSSEFIIETADGLQQQKYKQVKYLSCLFSIHHNPAPRLYFGMCQVCCHD